MFSICGPDLIIYLVFCLSKATYISIVLVLLRLLICLLLAYVVVPQDGALVDPVPEGRGGGKGNLTTVFS